MKSKAPVINVGLIGLGTVGTGVARILIKKHRSILERTGIDFRLKKVGIANPRKKRRVALGKVKVTANINEILNDPEIDQIVEVIGGVSKSQTYIQRALKNGKDVISANKALFAEKGISLYKVAQKNKCHIGLEASVGGGVPVIKALKEGLASNYVSTIKAILNGTCNLILTAMSQNQRSYKDALKDAQQKGFAEKNPLLDVSGADTAHKLAIIARIAFQKEIEFSKIPFEGIQYISNTDILHANEMGYTIKLLAIARWDQGKLELRVHPTLLQHDHLLSNVSGVNNAVLIQGDEVGEVLLYGKGAGERPTASAVVGDMIDLAKLRYLGIESDIRTFKKGVIKTIDLVESRYYLRLHAQDSPGVLGRITQILGRCNISISKVNQVEIPGAKYVPVIIMTHIAKESNLRKAIKLIDSSKLVKMKTVVLRVEL